MVVWGGMQEEKSFDARLPVRRVSRLDLAE